MVLPLLGLLALGATAAGKPFYDDWIEGREGRQANRALEGVGPGMMDQGRALLNAGLLSPETFASLGQDESQFGRGLMEDQRQFDLGQSQDQNQFDQGLQFDQGIYGMETAAATQADMLAAQQASEQQARLMASPLGQESLIRGEPWLTIDPEARAGITRMEDAVTFTDDMLDYVTNADGLQRPLDDQSSAEWRTRYQLTVLPVLKDIMGAGALDEGERIWFEEVMGDPLSWVQLTDREQARVRGLATTVQAELDRRAASYGLNPADAAPDVPAGLQPGLPPGSGGPVAAPGGPVVDPVAAPAIDPTVPWGQGMLAGLRGQTVDQLEADQARRAGVLATAETAGQAPAVTAAPAGGVPSLAEMAAAMEGQATGGGYPPEVQQQLDRMVAQVEASDMTAQEKAAAIGELRLWADRQVGG